MKYASEIDEELINTENSAQKADAWRRSENGEAKKKTPYTK